MRWETFWFSILHIFLLKHEFRRNKWGLGDKIRFVLSSHQILTTTPLLWYPYKKSLLYKNISFLRDFRYFMVINILISYTQSKLLPASPWFELENSWLMILIFTLHAFPISTLTYLLTCQQWHPWLRMQISGVYINLYWMNNLYPLEQAEIPFLVFWI